MVKEIYLEKSVIYLKSLKNGLMNNTSDYKFIFNWILINKLAVGTSPLKESDIEFLKKKKVKNILGLCSEEEIKWNEKINNDFSCFRIVLPDSNKKMLPTNEQLNTAFNLLKDLVGNDITFIHCVASMERSPLLCIMYVMEKYNISLEEALDFVKRVHSNTNPTNDQLLCITNYISNKSN
tara:strand:+ start:528 stop:1067 length:540 start_codon:yes stop_codon:yes gene_type:complete